MNATRSNLHRYQGQAPNCPALSHRRTVSSMETLSWEYVFAKKCIQIHSTSIVFHNIIILFIVYWMQVCHLHCQRKVENKHLWSSMLGQVLQLIAMSYNHKESNKIKIFFPFLFSNNLVFARNIAGNEAARTTILKNCDAPSNFLHPRVFIRHISFRLWVYKVKAEIYRAILQWVQTSFMTTFCDDSP